MLRLTSGNENRTNGAQHESLGGGGSAENGGEMEKLSARQYVNDRGRRSPRGRGFGVFLAGRGRTVAVGMKKNGLDDDAGRGAQENLQTADCSVVWLGGDAMCSPATVSATKAVRSTT